MTAATSYSRPSSSSSIPFSALSPLGISIAIPISMSIDCTSIDVKSVRDDAAVAFFAEAEGRLLRSSRFICHSEQALIASICSESGSGRIIIYLPSNEFAEQKAAKSKSKSKSMSKLENASDSSASPRFVKFNFVFLRKGRFGDAGSEAGSVEMQADYFQKLENARRPQAAQARISRSYRRAATRSQPSPVEPSILTVDALRRPRRAGQRDVLRQSDGWPWTETESAGEAIKLLIASSVYVHYANGPSNHDDDDDAGHKSSCGVWFESSCQNMLVSHKAAA